MSNYNEEVFDDDLDLSNANILNFDQQDFKRMGNNFNLDPLASMRSNNSFEKILNEYAMESPFGKNSLFYKEPDGQFLLANINSEILIKDIKQSLENKSILKYDHKNYYPSQTFPYFDLGDEKIIVNIKINTLSGEIDFSRNPEFAFTFNYERQKTEFSLFFPFKKYKDSREINKYAIKLSFSEGVNLQKVLNFLSRKLIEESKENIIRTFQLAFQKAGKNTNTLDFLYETAPSFVLEERKDENLFTDLLALSNERIDFIGTNENVAILNLLDAFKNKKWFYDKVNQEPSIARNLLENFSKSYFDKLILAFAKIGNSTWTNKEIEGAWDYELYYPEYDTIYADKTNVYDPYVVSTGFAYYEKGLKKFKIGTAIFAYDSRTSILPSNSREIGPDDMQFAYAPMRFEIENNFIYLPVFVAEYFTNKKIDEEWWTMLGNVVAGLLPEATASIKTVSTISKLFKGKQIQTVDELIVFLDKIDETVKATELEKYGIQVLFRGTTRNAQGELFSGNANSIANGASTSTDPIRAVIFGVESATEFRQKGFLQIFVPKELEGLNLQSPNFRYDLELEIIIKASPEELSKFAVVEMPIEDARQIVNKLYNKNIPKSIYINDFENGKHYLKNIQKLTPKQSLEFYKQVIKFKNK
jgi:hypothetical protein